MTSEPAAPEELASDLAGMLRTGVTVDACRESTALLGVAIVAAKAPTPEPNDLAVAAANLVREACARVDDLTSGPTAMLLGVAPGYRGRPLKERRREVAEALYIQPETLRKDREPSLLEAVADEIYAMDSAYRLRHHHRVAPQRDTGLQIDWVEQHRRYGRIWTPAACVRADLMVLLEWLMELKETRPPGSPAIAEPLVTLSPLTVFGVAVDPDEWVHFEDRAAQLTWRLAQHSQAVADFVEREGGLWIFGDPEAEVLAADALYKLDAYLPFGDRNKSWMRTLLGRAERNELDSFMTLLEAEPLWPRMYERWLSWAADAVAADEVPHDLNAREANFASPRADERSAIVTPVVADELRTDCGHWLAASDLLLQLMEDDWLEVAGWYRKPPDPAPETP